MDNDIVYCDANVFVDFITNRPNEFGTPLGSKAAKFFYNVLQCKYRILISEHVDKELYAQVKPADTRMLFEMLKSKDKILYVECTEEDREKARKYQHSGDALHSILAIKGKAKFVVTRNIKDFIEINLSIPILPENT